MRSSLPRQKSARPGKRPLFSSVNIWEDFNLQNLNKDHGSVLDAPVRAELFPDVTSFLFGITLNSSNCIKGLTNRNRRLMKATLDLAKRILGLHPGIELRHTSTTPVTPMAACVPNGAPRLRVDHVIELDKYPVQGLVLGLAKASSCWSGRQLLSQIKDLPGTTLAPLEQLANICSIAKVRYGYIQTNEEIVVCCFNRDGDAWKVVIKVIPWSSHGTNVLTTDLALWWLGMLALSETGF